MIKLKVKTKGDNVSFKIKTRKTNTFEHLLVMAKIYNYIKENTDMLDEEIKNELKEIIENLKEID